MTSTSRSSCRDILCAGHSLINFPETVCPLPFMGFATLLISNRRDLPGQDFPPCLQFSRFALSCGLMPSNAMAKTSLCIDMSEEKLRFSNFFTRQSPSFLRCIKVTMHRFRWFIHGLASSLGHTQASILASNCKECWLQYPVAHLVSDHTTVWRS